MPPQSTGRDFWDDFRDWLSDKLGLDEIFDAVNDGWNSARNWIQRRDPLALDLDGDGIETVGADGTLVFDHDGDGIKTGTGWVKGDDALLVLDRNGNGAIDNGAELFGVDTVLASGDRAADGFAALRDLDSNDDEVFDSGDHRFADVRLWRDLDQDGVADAGELISLTEPGIASIELDATPTSTALAGGNLQTATGTFTRTDGTTGTAGDVSLDGTAANLDLAANPFYREFTDTIPLTEQAAGLPDMGGSGKVRDLREAASQSSGLAELLGQFSAETTRGAQVALLEPMLEAWADTSGLAQNLESRDNPQDNPFWPAPVTFSHTVFGSVRLADHIAPGKPDDFEQAVEDITTPDQTDPYISESYRELIRQWDRKIHILEAFNGQYFFEFQGGGGAGLTRSASTDLQFAGGGSGAGGSAIVMLDELSRKDIMESRFLSRFTYSFNVSYSHQQLDLLQRSYDALKQSVYDALVLQTGLKPYLDAVSLIIEETGLAFDFRDVAGLLEARYQQMPGEAVRDLLDIQRLVGSQLNGLGWDGYGQLRQWLADAAALGEAAERTARLNELVAALADFGYGGLRMEGEGSVAGEVVTGSDTGASLNGAGGNDLLLGGDGDDILGGGGGADVLYGGKGSDTYVFNLGDGADTIVESDGADGTDVLRFGAGIAIGDLDIYVDGDSLVFAHINGRERLTIAHWFNSLSDGAHRLDTVHFADGAELRLDAVQLGGAGDDTLIGTTSSDVLIGGAGDDTLISDGDDWLNGGTGADTMSGSIGDDVYVVDEAGDVVIELAGEGSDTIDARASYTLPDHVENLRLRGVADLSGIGNELDNTILGNAGSNALYGMAGNDSLSGDAGNDLLDGGAGDDVMAGAAGDDTYVVDSAGDTVVELAGEGRDTVHTRLSYTLGETLENLTLTGTEAVSGTGNDLNNVLTGNGAANVLAGLGGNDLLEGGGGDDTIEGGAGDDRLDGGAGADAMAGGAGDDIYVVDAADDLVVEGAGEGADLVEAGIAHVLPDHVENLLLTGTDDLEGSGNALDNILTGNSGSNTLIGLDGDDWLDGGAGADLMVGGGGDDSYVVDHTADQAVENADEGTDRVRSTITLTLGRNLENLMLEGAGDIDATGNELDNRLVGNRGANVLDGGVGADHMAGGAGDDTYVLDDAADSVVEAAGEGRDTVIAPFDYTLGANVENLMLSGAALVGSGNELANTLTGTEADNVLSGLAGNDVLDGGAGADLLIGGSGDDTYVVDRLDDAIVELGGEGRDTVEAGLSWSLGAELENLMLNGGEAIDGSGNELDNVLVGNGAANTLTGFAGNDVLDGGQGADFMVGGSGDDTYVVDDVGDVVVEAVREGVDRVKAGVSAVLSANVDHLTLTGRAAIDGSGNELDNTITGNAAANILTGLAGDDVLDGAGGGDTLVGGVGDDRYVVDHVGDAVVEAADEGMDTVHASVTFALASNVENLVLTGTGSIDGSGNDLGNTLVGNGGNNRLDGGAGADEMAGGTGNDTYVVDDTGDRVTESAGGGTDAVEAAVSFALGDHVENLRLTGSASIDGTGNAAANMMIGNTGDNALHGLAGFDFLVGDAGDDRLDGGADADIMAGGSGDDVYFVDAQGDWVIERAGEGVDRVEVSVSYTLTANVENLVLTGDEDIDGSGNGLANVLTGNGGDNVLDGRTGADTMAGGLGDDRYLVDDAGDTVIELAGEGIDTVHAAVDYTLADHLENLVLVGASSEGGDADLAGTGNGLDNTITGNAGDNLLDGAGGADTLIGGMGDDGYRVDESGDTVVEAVDGGFDTVHAGISHALADNVENLVLTGAADIDGIGNNLDNVITANAGRNLLAGLAGNDTYVVDAADDLVEESADEGTDMVRSSATYTLSSHVENLILTGSGDIDGTGNGLDNAIVGNAGDNHIDGGSGADALAGGAGSDTYIVDDAGDTVSEAADAGVDLVLSSVSHVLAANVEYLTLTGTAAIDGTGNGLGNLILGNAADNRLDGGSGADTMAGGSGNDIYVVDNAGDVVTETAGEGLDTVRASVSHTLSAHVEKLTLTGSASIGGSGNELDNLIVGNAGSNALFGLAGDDTLVGNGGNDTLDGGSGADAMAGGAGHDTYVVDDAGDGVTEGLNEGGDLVRSSISYALGANVEHLTLVGTGDIDGTGNALNNVVTGNGGANVIDGGAGADSLLGGAGDDTVFGGSGDDLLDGGAGADVMAGGSGNDRYVVDDVGDLVIEVAGEGMDLVQSGITYTLTDNVENLSLTGAAHIDGTGNQLDNAVTGNSGRNVLHGLAGNDTLNGGGGADTMVGGSGDDNYVVDHADDIVMEGADEGLDTVRASVSHTLSAHVENLTLTGSANITGSGNALDNVITGNTGSNSLYGLDGNDTLAGNAGNDTLDGGSGADAMAGGAGNDGYVIDDAGDLVTESLNAGTDLVRSSISYTLAANVENLVLTGAAAVDGTGNPLANVITGNDAANVLDGAAGDDTIHGGSGDDRLLGGDGSDMLNGGLGADEMAGGRGNDIYVVDDVGDVVAEAAGEGADLVQAGITHALGANVENLNLTGTADIDGSGNELDNLIDGNAGSNLLAGLGGDDTLNGGAGADTMLGGAGDDTYIIDEGADVVIEAADEGVDRVRSGVSHTLADNVEHLTLTGSAGIDGTGNALDNLLVGNSGDNLLAGLAGSDTLTGGGGHDVLEGGSGADAMAGGLGNDTYVVDDAADRVTEYANEGTDTVLAGIDYVLGNHLENLTLTGSADLDVAGNALDNVLTGNGGNNLLDGGAGADRLVGGLGNDSYRVDSIGDIVTEGAGEGVDTVVAGVSHTLAANVEHLLLSGLADLSGTGNGGDNTLVGNDGASILYGEAGDDVLDGGLAADVLLGGAGDDLYLVDDAGDVVVEAADAGSDTVHASVNHVLSANVEHLVLTSGADLSGAGNALDNVLIGNAGNNVLEGGEGNDLLRGGGGSDLLRGGAGEDRYAFDPGDGNDRIADAQGFNSLELGGGLGAAALDAERIGDDMLIQLRGRADSVTLEDWFAQTATDGINAITFADGSRLDRDGIEALLNRPPVANPDMITAFEDGGPLVLPAGTLLANDSDPNPGDTLAVVAVDESLLGAAVALENGHISYDIGSRFQELGSGQIVRDRFGYTVMDRKGETASAWVDVDIVGVNDAPIVVKPLADRDITFNRTFYWQLPADSFEDVDRGDVLSYTATLADGSALPAWLHFDAEALAFSGISPRAVTALEIRVTATDEAAPAAGIADRLTASDVFTLTISHGNEGLGNGQDAPPAGHATNMNDDSGASPGSPGARTRGGGTTRAGTGATDNPAPTASSGPPSGRAEAEGAPDGRYRAATAADRIRIAVDLGIVDRDRAGASLASSSAGADAAAVFAQWLAIEQAMSRRWDDRDSAAWLDDGADPRVLNGATGGYLGSTTRFGRDAISLAGSGFLQTFTGLAEGVRRIA